MITVGIIGYGNLGQHLAAAFEKSDLIEVTQIYSKSATASGKFVNETADVNKADLIIIAVSDNAISEISSQLPFENQLIVHTSGSMPIAALDQKNRRGSFYPLQTFSKNRPVNWNNIPICIEAELDSDLELLQKIASELSSKVYNVNSDQRKALHLAAVFASNFTNHLYGIASKICAEHNLPFEILLPLIAETASKVAQLDPTMAQTGPAIRNDDKTINSHLLALNDENQKHIYELLTKSIQLNGKKL